MRILFVASLHHPPPPDPGSPSPPRKIETFPSTQAQHFWVKSLTKLGHTCEVFWRSESMWPWVRPRSLRMTERLTVGHALRAAAAMGPWIEPDLSWRNRRLIRRARTFRPDVLVMIGGNDAIRPGTLATIRRELKPILVYACGTPPKIFSPSIERRAASLYDLVVANDRDHAIQWLELGAPRAEVLPLSGVDPDFHRRRGGVTTYDVGFVGTLVPKRLYSRRIAALEALREFDLAIWSIHEVPASLRPARRGPALGEQMVEAISSARIVVNPHGDFMRYGGNLRLFETCGAGTFQIVDDLPGVHTWFRVGTDLVTYRKLGDLRDQVAHYLSNENDRQRIAASGQAHVYTHHTYDQRMARLLDLIGTIEDDQRRRPTSPRGD